MALSNYVVLYESYALIPMTADSPRLQDPGISTRPALAAYLQLLFRVTRAGIVLINRNGMLLELNGILAEMIGHLPEELVGKHLNSIHHPDDVVLIGQQIARVFSAPPFGPVRFEIRLRHRNGQFIRCEVDAVTEPAGSPEMGILHIQNISNRTTPVSFTGKNPALTALAGNIAAVANTSTRMDKLVSRCLGLISDYLDWPVAHAYRLSKSGYYQSSGIWYLHNRDDLADFRATSEKRLCASGEGLVGQTAAKREPYWGNLDIDTRFTQVANTSALPLRTGLFFPVIANEQVAYVVECFSYNTIEPDTEFLDLLPNICAQIGRVIERLLAESRLQQSGDELRRLNQSLNLLHKCDHAISHAISGQMLVADICNILVGTGNFRFAWVGYANDNSTTPVYPVAQAGDENGYLCQLFTSTDALQGSAGIYSGVITSCKPLINNNLLESYPPGSEFTQALERGFRSVAVLPLSVGTHTFGLLAVYSTETGYFDAERMKLMTTVTENLTFGILSLQSRKERERAERMTRLSEQKYRMLFEEHPSIFLTISADNRIESINKFGAETLGYNQEDLVGHSVIELHAHDRRTRAAEYFRSTFSSAEPILRHRSILLHKDGSHVYVRESARPVITDEGNTSLFVVCENITQLQTLSNQLAFQSTHDALTGLINRTEFEQRLSRMVKSAATEDIRHAICYIDLDHFKQVNHECGYPGGDELLRQFGNMLRQHMRSRDTIARLDSDKFVILMDRCPLHIAELKSRRLLEKSARFSFHWNGKAVRISMSMGLVPIAGSANDLVSLLKLASAACLTAKDNGRNQLFVYHEDSEAASERIRQISWISQINEALQGDRLQLYFQKIIPLQDQPDDNREFELLLRLENRDGKIIPANRFLPSVERFGLSDKIDRWVIEHTFAILGKLNPAIGKNLRVTINLSEYSLNSPEFVSYLLDYLGRNREIAGRICLEVNESAAINNISTLINIISELRQYGCRFSLDNFGSGSSSFSCLRKLDVDYFKIDETFISGLGSNADDITVLKSIHEMARQMGIRTVAKGVQNEAELNELKSIGIDYAQGFYIHHPVSETRMIATVYPAADTRIH
jgi:diguanylate cyclase (GGDEF)-like protein/PAS domain S-box-containing protein